ncbi:MAG: bacillithiol system redox-active protein YtxJ [Planctomycetota bacterium]
MPEQVIRDLDAFDAAVTQPRVLLFKHSPVCPVSAAARAQYRLWSLEHPDAPTLFVDVTSSPRLARDIAARCGVEHESPQAILFEQGEAVWTAAHASITQGALDAAWAPRC